METELLRKFLTSANKAGYASGNTRTWVKENDGSSSITYVDGSLTFHDNFFGGEPFGGRVIVAEAAQPKWIMVYYGKIVTDTPANPVFQFLRAALKQMPEEIPLRGPSHFQLEALKYTNQWSGDLSRFSGTEQISSSGTPVYEGFYNGGWVDTRSGV